MPTTPPALPAFWGSHSWADAIQDALCIYLADSVQSMTRDRVFPSIWDTETHLNNPPADRFITVFMYNFPVDQQDVTGGGAYNTAFNAAVTITAYTRVEADIQGRSIQFLREQVNGVYDFAQQIITPMQMWPGPLDADGVSQLRRPARIAPGWKILPRSSADGRRWGVVPMEFELSFVADLGVAYP